MLPLLRDDECLGVLIFTRSRANAFTDKEIALAKSFVDQAVIAIENVRLFNETKVALERQTATSDILRVISGSVTDTQPVFDVIAEHSAKLTRAVAGYVYRFDGEWLHTGGVYGVDAESLETVRNLYPMRPDGGSAAARAVRERAVVNI